MQEADAPCDSTLVEVLLHTRAKTELTALHAKVPWEQEYDVDAAPKSLRHPQAAPIPKLNWEEPDGQLKVAARDSTFAHAKPPKKK